MWFNCCSKSKRSRSIFCLWSHLFLTFALNYLYFFCIFAQLYSIINYFLVELFFVDFVFVTDERFVCPKIILWKCQRSRTIGSPRFTKSREYKPRDDPVLDSFRADDPLRDKSDFSALSFVPEVFSNFVEDFFNKDFISCSVDFILSIVAVMFSTDFLIWNEYIWLHRCWWHDLGDKMCWWQI